jgi:predicted dehydrogenase
MLNVGVIGSGKVSEKMHLPGFAAVKRCRLVAIADVNRELAGEIGARFGITNVFADYREMLRMKDLDAVSVCTPNFLHCRISVDASRAGKHVLVEKPIATSMKEVRQMVAAARKARRVLMVEQSQRFRPASQLARRLIARGAVGRINHVIGRFGHGGPERWAPNSKWFFDPKRAFGGAMADLGIHLVDIMRFIVPTPIVEVCGMTATIQRRMKLEDLGAITFRYADGALGQAAASWCLKPSGLRVEVSGAEGLLIYDQGEITISRQDSKTYKLTVEKPKIPAKSEFGSPWAYFVDCCLRHRTPMIDGVEGGKSLEVLIAGFESQRKGRTVKLPLR